MRKRQTGSTGVVVAALVFGLGQPIGVRAYGGDDNQGWTKSEITFALDTNVVNGCSSDGENVHLTGVGKIDLKTRLAADGTLALKEHDLFHGDGTGDTSGVRYKLREMADFAESLGPNEDGTPFSYVEQRRQRLVGMGSTQNQFITYYIELVIDGAGNVTVDIFDFNLECN